MRRAWQTCGNRYLGKSLEDKVLKTSPLLDSLFFGQLDLSLKELLDGF